MIRECLPDDIGISVSYPMPGTKFHAAVSDQLGAKQNWSDSSDLAMLYRGTFTTAYYRQLHRVVHKEYRARIALRRLPLGILGPKGGLRLQRRRCMAADALRTAAGPAAAPNPVSHRLPSAARCRREADASAQQVIRRRVVARTVRRHR
jgi:hypothetical protein